MSLCLCSSPRVCICECALFMEEIISDTTSCQHVESHQRFWSVFCVSFFVVFCFCLHFWVCFVSLFVGFSDSTCLGFLGKMILDAGSSRQISHYCIDLGRVYLFWNCKCICICERVLLTNTSVFVQEIILDSSLSRQIGQRWSPSSVCGTLSSFLPFATSQ